MDLNVINKTYRKYIAEKYFISIARKIFLKCISTGSHLAYYTLECNMQN